MKKCSILSVVGLLFLLVFVSPLSVCGQDGLISLKEKLMDTPASEFPLAGIKRLPLGKPGFALAEEQWQNLPIYTYQDLALQIKNNYNEDVVLSYKFDLKDSGYSLAVLDIYVSEPRKHLLVTYDSEGRVVDFLEGWIGWADWAIIKQWRIDAGRNIIVTWIKIDKPINFLPESGREFTDFGEVEGQRIDSHYVIDGTGKFKLVREVKYRPQVYTQEYLKDEDSELWDGKETKL